MKSESFFKDRLKLHYVDRIFLFYADVIRQFSTHYVSREKYSEQMGNENYLGVSKIMKKDTWDWFGENAYFSNSL